MKKEEISSTDQKYLEVTNKTKSCIVINSCQLILKPKGESGDSIIIESSKAMDNDIVGLRSANLVEISAPRTKKVKKQKDDTCASEKKPKISVNDKKGSKVVYVDHGKVKKGKMTRTIQDLRMVDLSNNANAEAESKGVEDDDDKHSEAFVDTK